MSKIWRVVITVALGLIAAGLVLLGAALLTGASVERIAELTFGGQAEMRAAVQAVLDRAGAVWAGVLEQIRSFF